MADLYEKIERDTRIFAGLVGGVILAILLMIVLPKAGAVLLLKFLFTVFGVGMFYISVAMLFYAFTGREISDF